MSPTDAVQSVLSRTFDGAVTVVGAVLAVAASTAAVGDGLDLPWASWLAVPLIVVIARFPLIIERPSGALQIGFDSGVLAFLVSVLEPSDAMLVWSVGAVASQLLSDARTVARVFNIGVMLTAGAVAIGLVDVLRGGARGTPQELAAVAVGCGAYFLIDYALSEVSVALEESLPVHSQLRQPDVATAMACIVAVDSLGYLAALVVRGLPVWSIALLAVPVVTLLVAVTSVARGRETARRMSVLLDVSTQVQAVESESAVLAAMEVGAHRLLKGSPVELRADAPGEGEVGARVVGGRDPQWLVTPGRTRTRATAASDQQNLEALALMGDEALARLGLTRELAQLARHDALTMLVNRGFFLRRVEAALDRCRDRPGRVGVLFCDLDGFKMVNDWFGHAAGDALLVDVARRLRSSVGQRDTVARLGGDEFAVLVEAVPDDGLSVLTGAVLRGVEQRYEVGGRCVTITTSIGVAFSDGVHTADQLIRNADIAMYEAKFAGRNQVVTYHPALGRERVRSLEQGEALRRAIDDRELSLVYQPVVQSSTGLIVGVEALVRWFYRGRSVPTDEFIAIAEETSLIGLLGDLVLDMVTRDSAVLRAASGGDLSIGVNVSAQQLRSAGFVAAVLQARDALDGLTLLLEITERQVVGDDPLVLAVIGKLEASGVRFALDDFGIGYSSIGYLQQLAVQVLKTDRLFSARIDTDHRSAKLLVAMVEMAHALGLEVVVEGIERPSQLEALRQHVPFADNVFLQGYLLARPVPLAEVARQLAAAQPPALRAV